MDTPAIDGWFTVDDDTVHLIGTRCAECRTVCFPPRTGFCPNPRCPGEELVPARLSRRGTVWSYTDARYPPPAPFVAAEPYTPVTLAAVELAEEGIVVLGQVKDLTVDDLHVGMELELTAGPLADGPLVWMWGRPRGPGQTGAGAPASTGGTGGTGGTT
ncbi:Zn-ribbon domain-containing OB-fold protein [Planobispora rosea]|uniref:Zn-ribbon domain-containing OB-fold protein n=1 Tax=Planobispora rosea TaxID=35762 RepID=UPI00083B70FC|nr:OB-fold domain-containing protein [Planobispora rosea]